MPAFEPVVKNFSRPACRNDRIMSFTVRCSVTVVKRNLSVACAPQTQQGPPRWRACWTRMRMCLGCGLAFGTLACGCLLLFELLGELLALLRPNFGTLLALLVELLFGSEELDVS